MQRKISQPRIQKQASLRQQVEQYFQHGITVKDGDCVIDVGANIGSFAEAVIRRAPKQIHYWGFEPIPHLYRQLRRRLDQLRTNAERHLISHCVGLTSIDGPSEATFSYYRRFHSDSTQYPVQKNYAFEQYFEHLGYRLETQLRPYVYGMAGPFSRLIRDIPLTTWGRNIMRWVTGEKRIQRPLWNLASVLRQDRIDQVDLLKIDVEGAEFDVIKGLPQIQWSKVKQLVLEGHDNDGRSHEIVRFLEEVGFDEIHLEPCPKAQSLGLDNFHLWARRRPDDRH